MTVRNVPFTKLIVGDLAAMTAFYTNAFGFVVRRRIEAPGLEEVLLGLDGDSFTLVLYRHTDGRALTRGTLHGPIGLATSDIDATWAAALAAGAMPVDPPRAIPGLRVAFADDPEGHPLEFIQYVRGETPQGAA